MSRRAWTTGEQRRLEALRGAGLSIPACAAALNRSRGSVSGQIVRMGLAGRAPAFRRKPGELKRCVRALVTRWGATAAADMLGVSRVCIYTTLARFGRAAP